ncbi:MAG: bacillithiol biosynthesis cysteine-adding enzyme BshC [Flavisolibacter sp.]
MFEAHHISYTHTNSVSKIILDYLKGSANLRPFYSELPNRQGLEIAIAQKKKQGLDRKLLVKVLADQYRNSSASQSVHHNIESLAADSTFSVCTAHQPNIFTGPLYFIYKILHAIKLADHLNGLFKGYHFVPLYYMGSEDADLAELNHFYVQGKKYQWNTNQTGAVGRMQSDKSLSFLVEELEKQLSVDPYGPEMIAIFKEAYTVGTTIQQATFKLVNKLFGKYGLIVLIADDRRLKEKMIPVFEDDLFYQKPSKIVEATCIQLSAQYKVQASPRDINLFYLKENIRQRIIKINDTYQVNGTNLIFSRERLKEELFNHPERFSPNVILRGLYQESILPNIAFIGGGGELAYWLQFKALFENYEIPYPVLILRNSVLIVEQKWQQKIKKLNISVQDLFQQADSLVNHLVQKRSTNRVTLNGNFEKAADLYDQIKIQAGAIDPTLSVHVEALRARSIKTLQQLEKKMIRAQKRKFSVEQRQIQVLKAALFPDKSLQERVENIAAYYSKWGPSVIDELYNAVPALDPNFTVLTDQRD